MPHELDEEGCTGLNFAFPARAALPPPGAAEYSMACVLQLVSHLTCIRLPYLRASRLRNARSPYHGRANRQLPQPPKPHPLERSPLSPHSTSPARYIANIARSPGGPTATSFQPSPACPHHRVASPTDCAPPTPRDSIRAYRSSLSARPCGPGAPV